jgi:hypothetical protein
MMTTLAWLVFDIWQLLQREALRTSKAYWCDAAGGFM